MATINNLKVLARLSLGILVVGIALITYMITVEGELGALPLLLVVVGAIGYCTTRYRLGKQSA